MPVEPSDLQHLATRVAQSRRDGAALAATVGYLADSVADTEIRLAETLDRIAAKRPGLAERLRALAAEGRDFPEHERRDAVRWSAVAAAQGRADGQPQSSVSSGIGTRDASATERVSSPDGQVPEMVRERGPGVV